MSTPTDPRPYVSSANRPLVVFGGLAVAMAAFMAAVFALGLRSTTGASVSPEQYATDFARVLPFGYAFSAGVVASVNPCGFMMLPAFVGYYLGKQDRAQNNEVSLGDLWKAALFGGMVTLGFVVLFTVIGSIISTGGKPPQPSRTDY